VEDTGEGAPVLRGWVKNLQTGREQVFGDARMVESILQEEVFCPEVG
jgi:hypothetical protein